MSVMEKIIAVYTSIHHAQKTEKTALRGKTYILEGPQGFNLTLKTKCQVNEWEKLFKKSKAGNW